MRVANQEQPFPLLFYNANSVKSIFTNITLYPREVSILVLTFPCNAQVALRYVCGKLQNSEYNNEHERYFLALDLVCYVLHLSRSQWVTQSESRVLSPTEVECINRFTARLLVHEPIQYITQVAPFASLELEVAKGVLIPRPETEELCGYIIQQQSAKPSLKTFIDLGSGSGAIAITLCKALANTIGYALEKSEEAWSILLKNIAKYREQLVPSEVIPINGDMTKGDFVPQLPRLDFVVSNPPYVQTIEKANMAQHVLEYEPHMALFAPEHDPLFFYRTIIELCKKLTFTPKAKLYLEINAALGSETLQLLSNDAFFDNVELLQDFSGRDRFIIATIAT